MSFVFVRRIHDRLLRRTGKTRVENTSVESMKLYRGQRKVVVTHTPRFVSKRCLPGFARVMYECQDARHADDTGVTLIETGRGIRQGKMRKKASA